MTTSTSQLDQLKTMTVVVADTGDYGKVKQYRPQDATTNPTLILQAVQSSEHADLVNRVIRECKTSCCEPGDLISEICDQLNVEFGLELLKIVPGRVSTEVDACLSFDVNKSVDKALKLIQMYEKKGVGRSRILVKLASTWEGIQACRILEKQEIHCNMTLIFNYEQAIACAQAGATLISPFVGRILDWYVKNEPAAEAYTRFSDPGVKSVTRIYKYFKQHGHSTTVMGASFRSKDEILGLAGIDSLTISPKLLEELAVSFEPLDQVLNPTVHDLVIPALDVTESIFRWALNEDRMASDKLAEGIRNFNKDLQKLKDTIASRV